MDRQGGDESVRLGTDEGRSLESSFTRKHGKSAEFTDCPRRMAIRRECSKEHRETRLSLVNYRSRLLST